MALSFTIVLVLVILVVLWWYFRYHEHSRKIKFLFWLIVIILLYLSITNVFLAEPIDFTSPKSIFSAVGVYFKWIGQTVANLWDVGRDTTGNVVKAVQHNVTS